MDLEIEEVDDKGLLGLVGSKAYHKREDFAGTLILNGDNYVIANSDEKYPLNHKDEFSIINDLKYKHYRLVSKKKP